MYDAKRLKRNEYSRNYMREKRKTDPKYKLYSRNGKPSDRFGGNRLKALERDNYRCVKCGVSNEDHKVRHGMGLSIDHIDNKGRNSKEKNHDLSNLQTLCSRCHYYKGNMRNIRPKLISDDQKIKIKESYKFRVYSCRKLAEEYGVSEVTIRRVLYGRKRVG